MIFEYTLQETSDPIIPVKWIQIRNPKGWKTDPDDLTPLQLRNLRNPDKDTSTCLNNVGSFQCVSNDEENIAIGWGGHTTDGAHRYGTFSVVLADGTTCIDHGIPEYAGRYAPQIGVLDKVYFCMDTRQGNIAVITTFCPYCSG